MNNTSKLTLIAGFGPACALLLTGVALNACTASQIGQAVADGQLFCRAKETTFAMALAAPGTSATVPVIVKGLSSEYVKAACDQIDGIAVVPPANPGEKATVVIKPIVIPLRG